MFNRHGISLISNPSVIEEAMSVSRRPKSSQGGINRHDLMRSANKMKSTGMKKYRKLVTNPREPGSEDSLKESSLQRYMDSLRLTKGAELSMRKPKSQPKNAAFLKHFMKKKKEDEAELIPKFGIENFPSRKKYHKTDDKRPKSVIVKPH
eukprot:TRINITY_DN4504_c0_g1_i2.p3 TRINITY_DN4504_c0_g1~~TRINITY_DN4504_c0_g1_i2.p3  ORF type:complete len:150 (-),score=39.83 TRINITY_DN4504_c0_g1_i2:91-540(-)